MHNCVELFSAPDDMKVNQGFTEHAIPWFLEHAIPCLLGVGVWRRTLCNPTHGPSGVLGESLECPCDPSSWLWVPKCTFHAQNSNFMNRSANFKWIADLSPQYQHNIYIYTVQLSRNHKITQYLNIYFQSTELMYSPVTIQHVSFHTQVPCTHIQQAVTFTLFFITKYLRIWAALQTTPQFVSRQACSVPSGSTYPRNLRVDLPKLR